MSKAIASNATSKLGTTRYAARPGSSFIEFVYSGANETLSGIFKAEGKAPLTAECVTERELAEFLAKPIRLRGQALQQLIVA